MDTSTTELTYSIRIRTFFARRSAALITSLSGAVVRFCGVACSDFPSVVHNLAQLSHCYAQGKVGSGFDVSSAAYGSHIYTR